MYDFGVGMWGGGIKAININFKYMYTLQTLFPKTILPSAFLSTSPSSPTMSAPKASTTLSKPGVPFTYAVCPKMQFESLFIPKCYYSDIY